ncbi:MAG: hypothetical protein E7464_02900 [Ruminococcaceae bacterium]|nr:hypothetical protein [Oscillospiraceae bacterium]
MRIWRVTALILCAALLLTGCSSMELIQQIMNEGSTPFAEVMQELAGVEPMVPFSQMPYTQPDEAALQELFDTATTLAEEAKDVNALMDALDAAGEAYSDFYTQTAIAMIHADSDQTNEKWQEEYAFCDRLSAQVEQWMEQMLQACALSKLRGRMEREGYFYPHELDAYEESDSFNDEIVALYQQESELVNDYRTLCADPEILLDGGTVKLNDYLAREDLTEEAYNAAYLAYLQQINEEAAALYCELVLIRRQIAEKSGYADYETFQYDFYGRDYVPQDVEAYLAEIRALLGPYREELIGSGEYDAITYPGMTEGRLMSGLAESMELLDPAAADAFTYMEEYELYNVSTSLKKAPTGYTTYLYSYNAPYIFVDTYGDVEDILYTAHEFGHFLSSYENGLMDVALDLEETYSQGMEYLTLQNMQTILSRSDYEALCRIKLLDTLDTYTQQGAYAAFEQAVYALPEESLNAETLNELFSELMQEYGCGEDGEEFDRVYWTQLSHLYEMPFYMLSYCVSVDSALQIYERALEDTEDAWEVYRTLLDSPHLPFLDAVEKADLESPMHEGRAKAVMELLEEQLSFPDA